MKRRICCTTSCSSAESWRWIPARFCSVDCSRISVVARLCRTSSWGRPGTSCTASAVVVGAGEGAGGVVWGEVCGGLALAICVGVAGLVAGLRVGVVRGREGLGFGFGVVVVVAVVDGCGVVVEGCGWGAGCGAGCEMVGAWACGGGTDFCFFLQPESRASAIRASAMVALRD